LGPRLEPTTAPSHQSDSSELFHPDDGENPEILVICRNLQVCTLSRARNDCGSTIHNCRLNVAAVMRPAVRSLLRGPPRSPGRLEVPHRSGWSAMCAPAAVLGSSLHESITETANSTRRSRISSPFAILCLLLFGISFTTILLAKRFSSDQNRLTIDHGQLIIVNRRGRTKKRSPKLSG
jgi:hypothetical protein